MVLCSRFIDKQSRKKLIYDICPAKTTVSLRDISVSLHPVDIAVLLRQTECSEQTANSPADQSFLWVWNLETAILSSFAPYSNRFRDTAKNCMTKNCLWPICLSIILEISLVRVELAKPSWQMCPVINWDVTDFQKRRIGIS